jgi:dihydropteroate synthase
VFAAEAARGPAITWPQVAAELRDRLAALPPEIAARAWVDPGLGFGKGRGMNTNVALAVHAGDLARAVGRPVVVGASRKRFVRRLAAERSGLDPVPHADDVPLAEVDAMSVEVAMFAVRAGAKIIRTHNVALLRAALAVYTKR